MNTSKPIPSVLLKQLLDETERRVLANKINYAADFFGALYYLLGVDLYFKLIVRPNYDVLSQIKKLRDYYGL